MAAGIISFFILLACTASHVAAVWEPDTTSANPEQAPPTGLLSRAFGPAAATTAAAPRRGRISRPGAALKPTVCVLDASKLPSVATLEAEAASAGAAPGDFGVAAGRRSAPRGAVAAATLRATGLQVRLWGAPEAERGVLRPESPVAARSALHG
jgi:hypothetical protein